MKLFIAGTQKTGNVWLERLLSRIYGIPTLDLALISELPPPLRQEAFVTHQHYLPTPELLDWGEREGVRFLTVLRHPADVFVSLYHYVNDFAKIWEGTGWLGVNRAHAMIGHPIDSAEVRGFLERDFGRYLVRSLAWLESGESLTVRYEDLRRDPTSALARLTARLEPVPNERIDAAAEACRFETMQAENDLMRRHCRRGKVGGWRDELDGEHVAVFKRVYARELALLGYDMDGAQPLPSEPLTARALAAIGEADEGADEVRRQLADLEARVHRRLVELADVDSRLEATSRELGYGRRCLEARDEELSNIRSILAAREEERDSLKHVLAARDEEVSSLRQVLEARNVELRNVKALLEAREKELAGLKAASTESQRTPSRG